MNVSSVSTNFFPTAQEGFTTTTSGTVASGAATVGLNSVAGYTNGDVVTMVIDPTDATKKQVFTGVIDTAGVQVTSVKWTEGTNQSHSAGATVADYETATAWGLYNKGISQHANQDGTLKQDAVQDALGVTSLPGGGWDLISTTPTVATGYNKGNKEYDLTFNADLSSVLSPGMRFKIDRTGTTPTQCLDLESSSSQYASKTSPTGITFTDDFTCEAWVKLESYTGALQGIVSRHDGTNGWILYLNSSGQLTFWAKNSGGTNDDLTTYQSLPLGQWVHVAATLDMSASTGTMYINGVSVPALYTNGTSTSLTQAGNLQVGAYNSLSFFDGKISDARVWSAIRTATQIRDNMNIQLVGNETNLVAYFKLNGNLNDSTSNANNLTGSGGAVATDTDHPFKSTEYGVISKVSYSAPNSTVTVFTPNGYTIPNMTLQNPYYSTQNTPFGFPNADDILRYTRTVDNKTSPPLFNTSQNLAVCGLVQTINVPANCIAQVTVALNISSTTDFEYSPQIYLEGSSYRSLGAHAAPGTAGGRAILRTLTAEVPLIAGTNTISAGVNLFSATSPLLSSAGAGYLTVSIVRGIGTGL